MNVIDDRLRSVLLRRNADSKGSAAPDIRRNNMVDVEYEATKLSGDVEKMLLALVRSYGLRFAAIDCAIDKENSVYFYEINPNGQWAWLDIVGGMHIAADFIAAFSQGGD